MMPVDERLGVVITTARASPAWDAATRFALAGHLVVVATPVVAVAEYAADRLRARGAAAFATQLDLTSLASINSAAIAAAYLAGPIDVLIDVAAPTRSPRHPTSDAIDRAFGVQHLVARLLDLNPQRAQPDLLTFTFTEDTCHGSSRAASSALRRA